MAELKKSHSHPGHAGQTGQARPQGSTASDYEGDTGGKERLIKEGEDQEAERVPPIKAGRSAI